VSAAVAPALAPEGSEALDRGRPTHPARRSLALLAGLGVAIVLRYLASASGVADGVSVGLVFGAGLLAIAWLDDRSALRRGTLRRGAVLRGLVLGILGGAALLGLAILARLVGGVGEVPSLAELGRGVAFPGWALATLVVAGGEEALLRGALFRRLAEVGGPWWAIGATSLAFALMHVPFYGWHVVPLDLGVGVWQAGLRLESRGILAPWLAHAIADLATWWL
jgi:membrane protease YdiL (CAAX protease family)